MIANDDNVELFHAIFYDDINRLCKAAERDGVNTVNDNMETPLIYAVMMEKSHIVSWLLAHGADMYSRDIFGDTAFHLAAKKGLLDIVNYFCIYKIQIDILGDEGLTALNYAVIFDHNDVASLLVKKGASLTIADNLFHKTPLDRILEKGQSSTDWAELVKPNNTL